MVDSRPWSHYILIAVIAAVLLSLNYFYLRDYVESNSDTINNYTKKGEEMEKVRTPAVAGLFYTADSKQLSREVDAYLDRAVNSNLSKRPKILVVPHAGYQYSALVAASAYKKLIPYQKEIKNVILIGPSHRVALNGVALPSSTEFKTPLGNVGINTAMVEEFAKQPGFVVNDQAHALEHSLEVQIPFLQKVLKNFKLVPMVYGNVKPETLAAALEPYLSQKDTIIVFSADLSHYLDYDSAVATDAQTARMVNQKQELEDHRSCGAIGINTALLLAKSNSMQPYLLDMANSGDVSGERDSVVGYASWAFLGAEAEPEIILTPLEQEVQNLKDFASAYGRDLLKIAQTSIEEAALHQHRFKPSRKDYDDNLFNKGAAFVTLTINGNLRGCIGSLIPNTAIALDVAHNAYAAALEDGRFPPLTAEELPQTAISISLLSGFERIRFESETDLLSKIVAGTDGLVIRDGDRQGLFLPSVWKELPDKQEFLNNLKLKAGMSPSYWSNKIKIYRFRVVEIKNNAN